MRRPGFRTLRLTKRSSFIDILPHGSPDLEYCEIHWKGGGHSVTLTGSLVYPNNFRSQNINRSGLLFFATHEAGSDLHCWIGGGQYHGGSKYSGCVGGFVREAG